MSLTAHIVMTVTQAFWLLQVPTKNEKAFLFGCGMCCFQYLAVAEKSFFEIESTYLGSQLQYWSRFGGNPKALLFYGSQER